MKTFWLILAAGPALVLNAQTNPPPPATTPEAPLRATTPEPAPPKTSLPAPAAVLTTTNGTGSIAATNALATEPPATEIFSDAADFNLKTRIAVYLGHVRVVDPRMKLTCERLTAKVPESGGRIDSIVAEENVVIDAVDERGNPVHATSDKAVYTYNVVNSVTNETIELTGNPRVAREQGFITGDPIIWYRQSNQFRAINQHMVLQAEPAPEPHTNAPPPAAPPKEP